MSRQWHGLEDRPRGLPFLETYLHVRIERGYTRSLLLESGCSSQTIFGRMDMLAPCLPYLPLNPKRVGSTCLGGALQHDA